MEKQCGTRLRTMLVEFAGEFMSRLMRLGRRPPRKLRLCESLPLGDRRFLAVVEFQDSRFLIGATPNSLALLKVLDPRIHSHKQCRSVECSTVLREDHC
jgi:flagellar biogenesis protein FliO